MFATIAGNNPGTALVWAGPGGAPMIRVEGSLGVRLHDLNLLGNSNPANQPSAMIELANSTSYQLVQPGLQYLRWRHQHGRPGSPGGRRNQPGIAL